MGSPYFMIFSLSDIINKKIQLNISFILVYSKYTRKIRKIRKINNPRLHFQNCFHTNANSQAIIQFQHICNIISHIFYAISYSHNVFVLIQALIQ